MKYIIFILVILLTSCSLLPNSEIENNKESSKQIEAIVVRNEASAPMAIYHGDMLALPKPLQDERSSGGIPLGDSKTIGHGIINGNDNKPLEIDSIEIKSKNKKRSSISLYKESIDDLMNQLFTVSMVFNVPETFNIDEKVIAELLISKQKTLDELETEISNDGNKLKSNILVSKIVTAKLISNDIKINNLSSDEQPITNLDTEWKWELIPINEGKVNLHLTIDAEVILDNDKLNKTIKTFDRTITIEITKNQRLVRFFKNEWKWFLSSLLIPLFIYGYKEISSRRKI